MTLGGRWLGRSGRWIGRRTVETLAPGPHGYLVTVPGQSAALLGTQVGLTPAATAVLRTPAAAARANPPKAE